MSWRDDDDCMHQGINVTGRGHGDCIGGNLGIRGESGLGRLVAVPVLVIGRFCDVFALSRSETNHESM